MKRLFLSVVLLLGATGCIKPEQVPALADKVSFQYLGSTFFAHPESLTLKEIHLDNGGFAGRDIIIEGKVAQVSDHGTYLVLTDDVARMLVVLTDLDNPPRLTGAGTMKVLGTIEAGKKGLPFVKARSVNVAQPKA